MLGLQETHDFQCNVFMERTGIPGAEERGRDGRTHFHSSVSSLSFYLCLIVYLFASSLGSFLILGIYDGIRQEKR